MLLSCICTRRTTGSWQLSGLEALTQLTQLNVKRHAVFTEQDLLPALALLTNLVSLDVSELNDSGIKYRDTEYYAEAWIDPQGETFKCRRAHWADKVIIVRKPYVSKPCC